MQELAIRGHGIAFQTRVGLERRLAEGSLVFVPIDAKGPLWSDLGIYTRSGRLLPTATDTFVQALKTQIYGASRLRTKTRADAVSAAGCATFSAIL